MKRPLKDPFDLVVPEHRVHGGFRTLRQAPGLAPARALIRELIGQLEDADGNFLEQFQSDGFHARLWELYLNTYFLDAYFSVGRDQRRPDFVLAKAPFVVCVEATTVNPTQGASPLAVPPTAKSVIEEVRMRNASYLPIKLGSALTSKLDERYWELDVVKGKPFVVAIMDFHELAVDRFSIAASSAGLLGYLYGIDQEWHHDDSGRLIINTHAVEAHTYGPKRIPSGFFALEGAEHVSAVMYSNSATLPKFNRMGYLKGLATDGILMGRKGVCIDHDPRAATPLQSGYLLGDPRFPEPWGQGLDVFHNPRALHPLHPDLFPDTASHRFDGQQLRSRIPAFHPLASATFVTVATGDAPQQGQIPE